MYIVIIGLGEVGRHLIRALEPEGHDIVAIDSSPDAVRAVEEHHDVMTLLGYGAGMSVLEKAGAKKADLVVAVTNHDEVNLVAALAGRQLGAKRAIARAEGKDWAHNRDGVQYGLLGVDVVINPSVLVAKELIKVARSHGAVEVIEFAQDRIELVQVEVTEASRFVDKPLSRLPLPAETLVAAVTRDGELFVPGGADVLLENDRVYLVGRPKELPAAEALFSTHREARRVCVAGGGVTGEAIARGLLEARAKVTIIESSLDRAQELSASLDGVTVLHGDATDTKLLAEEDIGSYDFFAAVTADDEMNLMATLLSKSLGVKRTAASVERPDYMPIYEKLGVDVVVSPRTVASHQILRFCRRHELERLTVLQNGQAEVLEIRTDNNCRAVGVPLRQLGMPRGALVAAIVHQDQVVIPRGENMIEGGDTVVVLATRSARASVERMFRPRLL